LACLHNLKAEKGEITQVDPRAALWLKNLKLELRQVGSSILIVEEGRRLLRERVQTVLTAEQLFGAPEPRLQTWYMMDPAITEEGAAEASDLLPYLTDLTAEAREGKGIEIIGRYSETTELIEKLAAPGKNSCVVVGPAGSGKTTLARGLARAIVEEGMAPEALQNRRIVELNLPRFCAEAATDMAALGTALTELIGWVQERKAILVIDEICSVNQLPNVGTFFWNALKDALAQTDPAKKVTIVGTTTPEQYKEYFGEDKSGMLRRLPKIDLEELSDKDTLLFLTLFKEKWQAKAGVEITQAALAKLVNLAKRHIVGAFPDKAITILDATAARLRGAASRRARKMKDLTVRLEVLVQTALGTGPMEQAVALNGVREALAEYDKVSARWRGVDPNKITPDVIAETIARKTGQPVTELDGVDRDKLQRIEAIFDERIIGQPQAKAAVAKAIRRSRTGFRDEKKPAGAFMFMGPTGVGKTEMAKEMSRFLFGSSNDLIRLDMSEFKEKHEISKLIGSPPGYVGHGEDSAFEPVRQKPYRVVLFDEIEKAHPEVLDILLQILEEGECTDGKGRKISFRDCYIVLTSNLGAGEAPERIREVVARAMRPELIGRFGEENQIIFDQLTKKDMRAIVDIHTKGIESQLRAKGYGLEITEEAKQVIADAGFDPRYGARPLKRAIARLLEDQLANLFISGFYTDDGGKALEIGDTIRLEVSEKTVSGKMVRDLILVKGDAKSPPVQVVLSADMEGVFQEFKASIEQGVSIARKRLYELLPDLARPLTAENLEQVVQEQGEREKERLFEQVWRSRDFAASGVTKEALRAQFEALLATGKVAVARKEEEFEDPMAAAWQTHDLSEIFASPAPDMQTEDWQYDSKAWEDGWEDLAPAAKGEDEEIPITVEEPVTVPKPPVMPPPPSRVPLPSAPPRPGARPTAPVMPPPPQRPSPDELPPLPPLPPIDMSTPQSRALDQINRLMDIYAVLSRRQSSELLAGCVDSFMFSPTVFRALVEAGYIIPEQPLNGQPRSRTQVIKGNLSPKIIEGKNAFVDRMQRYLNGVSNIEELYIFLMKALACKILKGEIDLYYQTARRTYNELLDQIRPQSNAALRSLSQRDYDRANAAVDFIQGAVRPVLNGMNERSWDEATYFTEKVEVVRVEVRETVRTEYVYSSPSTNRSSYSSGE
jgi:ATP-dependent Clp protease ATP-binding subunit ClpC